MQPKLRPYQIKVHAEVQGHFRDGATDVGVNSGTGTGKTVMAANEVREHNGGSVAIAHRQELVTQLSVAFARNELRHRVIGSDAVKRNIVSLHMADGGRSFYDPTARCAVAGIDTLIRLPDSDPIFTQSTQLLQDEAHHVLRTNKWGKGRDRFKAPSLRAIHYSASWCRADGKGLGRKADGYVDVLVNAPSMREQINAGYLTPYKVRSIRVTDLNLDKVEISKATGDLNLDQLRKATKASNMLVGNVVETYRTYTPGKLGVVFAVDVESCQTFARAFRDAGIKAEVVTADTPDHLRMEILRRFRRREVMVLINVDLFGEGFDLPAIEVVMFARATESWPLYCQQWGRVLRLMLDPALYPIWDDLTNEQRRAYIAASAKPFGYIHDHVGNLLRHLGPPDARTSFGLERAERSGASGRTDAIPYRVCLNPNANGTGLPCDTPYERFRKVCPYCGHMPEPAGRSLPSEVEGDLYLLDDEALALMSQGIMRVDSHHVAIPVGATPIITRAIQNRHYERQEMQKSLRGVMAWWSGLQHALGVVDLQEQQRMFYLRFGVDVGNAQMLGTTEAEKLRNRIADHLLKYNIDGFVNPALN